MVMQYRICPECGAHLDPAEVCDCGGVTTPQGDGMNIQEVANENYATGN